MPFKLPSAKRWLLFDAIGALLSAVILGLVWRYWLPITGMPSHILWVLASVASMYAMFSSLAWLLSEREIISIDRTGQMLRIIALANIMFCIGSAALVVVYRNKLTTVGTAYFLVEILVVLWLANQEWRAGMRVLLGFR